MKIKLPTAAERRQQISNSSKEKEDSMRKIVCNYLNGQIKKRIASATGTGINEEVPVEAYRDTKLFYTLCSEALTPLGYECKESHDGAGMFSTLCVSWK